MVPKGGIVDAAEACDSAPSGPVPDEPGFGNYERTESTNGPHRLHQIVDLVSGKAPAAGNRTGIAVDSPAAGALPLTNTTSINSLFTPMEPGFENWSR